VEAPQLLEVRPIPREEKKDVLSVHVGLHGGNVVQNPTPAHWEARPEGGSGESYLHDLDDKLEYIDDTSFACRIPHRSEIDMDQLLPKKSSALCDRCRPLDWNAPTFEINDSLAGFRIKKEDDRCELCAMLLRIAEKTPTTDWVEFDRVDSGLRINKSPTLPVLTIRKTSGELYSL
jgi:hypothetical protein